MSVRSRRSSRPAHAAAFLALAVAACGPGGDEDRDENSQGLGPTDAASTDAAGTDAAAADAAGTDAAVNASSIKFIFVIAMENHDQPQIIGNTADAPYINETLIPSFAQSTNFNDELTSLPSEPHYVWMEAGTNDFSDNTFTNDDTPSASNSTSSTAHLSTQIDGAGTVSWLSYQEGIDDSSGACPIASSGFYQPKHDPFIFFQDVSGNPPSKDNAGCAEHHREISQLFADLETGAVASYNFVTPDQCHDMHGQFGCPDSNEIRSGDTWLSENLPALISFVNDNSGVIFLTWDEGEDTTQMPFLAIGPHVKPGFAGSVSYDHSSLLKSVERILGLPFLDTVAGANELDDLFEPGFYP